MDNNDEDNKKPYKVSVFMLVIFLFLLSSLIVYQNILLCFSTPEISFLLFCFVAKQLILNLNKMRTISFKLLACQFLTELNLCYFLNKMQTEFF